MTGTGSIHRHVPVLLEETLEGLAIRQGGVYLDGTLGAGGHALQILRRYSQTRVIGLDRDAEALETAASRLAGYGDRMTYVKRDFRELEDALDDAAFKEVDGILADLGVSTMQLEEARRGFSFMHEGPLDMRMDTESSVTAALIVNTWSREDLADLIFRYGEDKRSRAIASAIVREREKGPIRTTLDLARIVGAVPGMGRIRKIHPATRTFQALRIVVNDELGALEKMIPAGIRRLAPGGRMAIITFHSLEDRVTKRMFRQLEKPCRCPKEYPECRCGGTSAGRIITRRPVVPGEEEITGNPRSRSAKLRVFERNRTQDAAGGAR